MNKIRNYNDLQLERERLHNLLDFHKGKFNKNLKEIKEELQPATSFIKLLGKITSRNHKSETVNMALDFGGNLLKKTVLSKLSWPLRLVVPFITKNLASHFIADSKNTKVKQFTEALP